MSLFETINKDFTSAMKERRDVELSTLRMLRAALKNRQIELMSAKGGSASGGHELSEEEALSVLKGQIKQVKDSIDAFEAGCRTDLVLKAKAEFDVLERYLPAQLSDVELETTVKGALMEAGVAGKTDMGRAMGAAMKAVAGRADGARVKSAVEKFLACAVISLTTLLIFAPQVLAAATKGTATAQKEEEVSPDWFSGEMPELAYRLARAFSVMFAIFFICNMLIGAFQQMTSSGKDEEVKGGRRKIAIGFFGALFMVMVYYLASNALLSLP